MEDIYLRETVRDLFLRPLVEVPLVESLVPSNVVHLLYV